MTKKDNNVKPLIMECICYSPAFIKDPFCNVYSTAISGVIGALDAVPIDRNDSRRKVHIHLDDDYYYDFPIQIDDGHDYPYGFLDGAVSRICSLLDDDRKKECCDKYDWMRQFLFPGSEADDSKVFEKGNYNQTTQTNSKIPSNEMLCVVPTTSHENTENDDATPPNETKGAENETEPKNDATGLDFDKYVLYGAQVASKKPFAKNTDDFASNPDNCFLSMFLTNRFLAADDLLKQYPEYQELMSIIIDNQKEFTTEKLLSERDAVIKLSNQINGDGEMKDGRYILTVAYAVLFSHTDKSKMTTILREYLLNRMLISCTIQEEWEKKLVAAILWFADKDGYKERVLKTYNAIKDSPEYNTIEKTPFETYVQCGVKFAASYSEDIDSRFFGLILSFRLEKAEQLASADSSFVKLTDMINATNHAIEQNEDYIDLFKSEYDQLCLHLENDNALLDNTDYLILLAAETAYMERFEAPEDNDARAIIKRIEDCKEELFGIQTLALYCSALWFSNYDDYQQKVQDAIERHKSDENQDNDSAWTPSTEE